MEKNTKTTKQKVLSVRMKKEDYDLLCVASFTIGMTPSRMVRMLCDSAINGIKIKLQKGEMKIEDIQAILDNLV